jgi:hypothetical protein
MGRKFVVKLLLENWRKYLLTEAAKKPRDLPPGINIVINHKRGGTMIQYVDEDGRGLVATQDGPWGEIYIVNLKGREHGQCGGAWKVSSANAGQGWGPMLYDVAIEYATIMADGLVADRDAVSPEARRVWDYYFMRRGDTTAHQLDNLNNDLTPEIEEDNCDQRVAGFDIARPSGERYGTRKKTGVDWTKSPLSKRYTKESATMDALIALDKLVEK